ncbi:MAG: hypothetical protein MOB07_27165 [Acidobacteria bacterium]|nr:hypothetical protein [Acidobacteriota bacterium]
MEPEIITNQSPDGPANNPDEVASLDALEPQTELGAKLIALAKEIDASGIPKLTIEEIEGYLGRELGAIAEALGDA